MSGTPGIHYVGVTTVFYCTDGEGRYLFGKRSINCRDEHGTWDTGGGKLEVYLTPEENVLAEVKQEYGCDGRIIGCTGFQNVLRQTEQGRTHWLALGYIVLVDPAQVRNNEPHKFDDLQWFDLDHLPTPLHSALQERLKHGYNIFKFAAKNGEMLCSHSTEYPDSEVTEFIVSTLAPPDFDDLEVFAKSVGGSETLNQMIVAAYETDVKMGETMLPRVCLYLGFKLAMLFMQSKA